MATTDGLLGTSNIPDSYIVGADELIKVLDQLEPKLSRTVLFEAHKTVLKNVVRPSLKSALSIFGSASRTSVSIRKAKGTQSGAYIGITTKAFWLRFINYGTEERHTKQAKIERIKTKRYHKIGRWGRREASYRGRVIPNPVISSTLEQRANDVLREVQENYADLIEQAMNDQLQKIKRQFAKYRE